MYTYGYRKEKYLAGMCSMYICRTFGRIEFCHMYHSTHKGGGFKFTILSHDGRMYCTCTYRFNKFRAEREIEYVVVVKTAVVDTTSLRLNYV